MKRKKLTERYVSKINLTNETNPRKKSPEFAFVAIFSQK